VNEKDRTILKKLTEALEEYNTNNMKIENKLSDLTVSIAIATILILIANFM